MKLFNALLVSALAYSSTALAENTNLLSAGKEAVTTQAVSQLEKNAKSALSEQVKKADESKNAMTKSVKEQATQSTQAVKENLNSAKNSVAQKTEQVEKKVAKAGKVNINTADLATLQTLNGIGEVKAKAIMDYRQKYGPFKNSADLAKVPGIGPATIEALKSTIQFK